MSHTRLVQAVERFTQAVLSIPDAQLDRPWAWQSYDSEGIRFAFFRTYEELRALAVRLRAERARLNRPLSEAQQILGSYTAAWWDLQAALLGLDDDRAVQPPSEGEWPVKTAVSHVLEADLGFYVSISFALKQLREGNRLPIAPREIDFDTILQLDEAGYQLLMAQPLPRLQDYYRQHFLRVLTDFSTILDDELELPSRYWEIEPMSLRFRLHRFDAHLRQHTIQVDKTLAAIGLPPSEVQRLLRLIYSALAEVGAAGIGAGDVGIERLARLAETIEARRIEIEA